VRITWALRAIVEAPGFPLAARRTIIEALGTTALATAIIAALRAARPSTFFETRRATH
jgi:hypothetical protein